MCEFSENAYRGGRNFLWIKIILHLWACHKPLDISKVKTATVSRSPVKSLPLMISHGALIQTAPVVIKCVPHILSRPSSRTQNFRARTHKHTHTYFLICFQAQTKPPC